MNTHAMPEDWSPQQVRAIDAVLDWMNTSNRPQVFRLFGYAGTGKTTLAKEIAKRLGGKVLYGAFTGKASQVLRQKGCEGASTIHSMIYKVDDDGETYKWLIDPDSQVKQAQLVIIDECSMVDQFLGEDLLSFGTPVLVLGDPFQLPPVKGAGFFTEHEPDQMLTEVHRQAEGNPIIRLSMEIRGGSRLQYGDYGAVRVVDLGNVSTQEVVDADQVLVGTNKKRQQYNERLRELHGYKGVFPNEGERLVCLKNNREAGLFNGSLWEFISSEDMDDEIKEIWVKADSSEHKVKARILNACFDGDLTELDWTEKRPYDEFTFGYALTVHKSQGSQWDSVYLFDQSGVFRDDAARWLYTGVTRAAERLTVAK